MAYKYYDEHRMIGGKTLKDHLRFATAYWHTFCGTGLDPFGAPTKNFPWLKAADPVQQAKDKMDAAFEFITKWACRIIASMILIWWRKVIV